MSETSFLQELRKRKVVQVAAIYGVVAWGATEIIVTVVDQLFLPQWVSTLAVIGFVVGFPVAIFFGPDGQLIGATNEAELEPARRYSSRQILMFLEDIAERSLIASPDFVHTTKD